MERPLGTAGRASVVLVVAVARLAAGQATDPLQAAMACMEHYSAGIRSARLEYRVETEDIDFRRPQDLPTTKATREVFVWKGSNKKLLRHYVIDDAGTATLWEISAWDGEKQYGHRPSVRQGFVQSQPEAPSGFPPTYYNFAYHCAGPRLLLDRLDRARDLVASPVVVEGRSMVELTWQTQWTDCSAVLDPSKDYQPVKFQQVATVPEPERAACGYVMGTVTVIVQEHTKADGFYFPKRVTKTWDLLLHDGSTVRAFTQRLWLESVKPNVSVEDSLFQIEFPPGTELSYLDSGISLIVAGTPQETEAGNILRQENPASNGEGDNRGGVDASARASRNPSVGPDDPNGVYPPLADGRPSREYLYALAVVAAVVLVLSASLMRKTR